MAAHVEYGIHVCPGTPELVAAVIAGATGFYQSGKLFIKPVVEKLTNLEKAAKTQANEFYRQSNPASNPLTSRGGGDAVKAWSDGLESLENLSMKPFSDKLAKLEKPLKQAGVVFSEGGLATKVAMGAIAVGAALAVSVAINKVRNWNVRRTQPEMNFEQQHAARKQEDSGSRSRS